MDREFSAGGVVLRKMRGRWFVAVIEPHMDHRRSRPRSLRELPRPRKIRTRSPQILPKGAIDEGEKPEQTAIREVEEETGLRAEVVKKLADIKYVYVRNWGNHARVFKIVSFLPAVVSLLRQTRQHYPGDARGSEAPSGFRSMKLPRHMSYKRRNARLSSEP